MTIRPTCLLIALSSFLLFPASATEYIVNFGPNLDGHHVNIDVDDFIPGEYYSYSTTLISNAGAASNIHLSIQAGQEVPKLGLTSNSWNNSLVSLPSGLHQHTGISMDAFNLDFTGLDATKTYTISMLVSAQDYSTGASDGLIMGSIGLTKNSGELISSRYATGSSSNNWENGTLINMPSTDGITSSGIPLAKGEWTLVEFQIRNTEQFTIQANASVDSRIEKIDVAGLSIVESDTIPEPASAGLILLGLGGMSLARRKRSS